MRFNIEDYPGNYAMHCKTLREAKRFLAHLTSIGKAWNGGDSYIGREHWLGANEENTGYEFNAGRYGNIEFYNTHGYTVLEWSDFMYDTPAGKIDDLNDYDRNLVTILGIDWFKLPEENGLIPIVAKDKIDYTDFDNKSPRNNNFATSRLLAELQEYWLPKIESIVGADNVIEFETDLMSVYGETDYGTMRSKISLPTFEMYKKHLKTFHKYTKSSECFWLATPFTTTSLKNVCLIAGHDYLNSENPTYSYNIHPVLYIKAEALTTQN